MVAKYHSKREKSQEAKWRSAVEWRPVHVLERAMDVDLYLEMQGKWAKDSPHHLVILQEMFCHAASEGWKEAEQIICQGHWQHMPQLNPEVGIPAVELVGLETSREELLEIYLEVYKLHRLPGSPPGGRQLHKRCWLLSQTTCREGKRLLKPELNLALEIPTHPRAEGPTGNEKARWIEVLPGGAKCTKRHCLL